MKFEDIIDELGGFSKFQIFIVLWIYGNRFTIGWSMLQMSYAGIAHDWYCMSSADHVIQNGTLNACEVKVNRLSVIDETILWQNSSFDVQTCTSFRYLKSMNTIVDEWNLVCEKYWIKDALTSIQMAGVLVGSIIAGQMGDHFGRKKTLYLFVLEHAVLNIITAFSTTWLMFAVCRFFIGIGIGAVIVASYPYPLEYMPIHWRPLISVLPLWTMGVGFFALMSYLLESWWRLHLACGLIALPGLLGYFFIPESVRWLTVKNRLKDAEKVVHKIAGINKRPVPLKTSQVLQSIAKDVQASRHLGEKYTYLDIIRDWRTAKITVTFCIHWFSLSFVYYGLSFGVSNLSGSLYLNIFLLASAELPAKISTFYFNNKIGRKRTCLISLGVACCASISCIFAGIYGPEEIKGQLITGLCLTLKIAAGAGWAVIETWGAELYPTVTRSLGYGAVNIAARLGGIIAPFAINLGVQATFSYTLISCLLFFEILLAVFTDESQGRALADSLNRKEDNSLAREATLIIESPLMKAQDLENRENIFSIKL